MFQYYSSLILLAVLGQFALFVTIKSDHLLQNKDKNNIIKGIVVLTIATLLEWVFVYIINFRLELTFTAKLVYCLMRIITPLIPFFVGLIFKDYKNVKIFYFLFLINIVVNFFIMVNFEHVSTGNLLDIKNLHILSDLIFIITIILMCENIYDSCKIYQSSNFYIMASTAFIMLFTNSMRLFSVEVRVSWLAGTVGIIFTYAYYTAVVNKLDSLTKLLNRRCFQNKIKTIKNDCCVVIIDLNKFKEINDTQGHSFGDYILQEIADIIKSCYDKYGKCYRIGGDEFCVILDSRFELVEELNKNVHIRIKEKRATEPLLPSVSIGHSKYIAGKNTIKIALEEADRMMYVVKGKFNEQYKK